MIYHGLGSAWPKMWFLKELENGAWLILSTACTTYTLGNVVGLGNKESDNIEFT